MTGQNGGNAVKFIEIFNNAIQWNKAPKLCLSAYFAESTEFLKNVELGQLPILCHKLPHVQLNALNLR